MIGKLLNFSVASNATWYHVCKVDIYHMNALNKDITRRFRPLYAAAFFQAVIFWFSIEKLFLSNIGLDDRAIALSIIIFSAVNLVSDLPIGILADRWSRTGVLMLSSAAMAIASLAGALSDGFWPYVVTLVFAGFAMASSAGVFDTIVYDTLKEQSISSSKFNAYYARLRFYDGLALIFGSFASAVIVNFMGLPAAYYLTIPFSLASIIFLFIFKEPKEHHRTEKTALKLHIGETIKAVSHNKQVLIVGLNLIVASVISSLILGFGQLWFIALSLPLILYGPFDGLLLSSFSIGGYLREKVHSQRVYFILAAACVIAGLALFIRQPFVVVAAQAVILISLVFYTISLEELLHHNLSSKVRAGGASVVSTAGTAVFLIVAYLVGVLSDQKSIFDAAWVILGLIILLLLASITILPRLKKI